MRDAFYGYHYSHDNCSIRAGSHTGHDYELSYLLQYVEENGRNHGDSWSFRQTGVYQQASAKNRRSAWIFLQLSHTTRQQLECALQLGSNSPNDTDSVMRLHSVLLLATVDNWGRYIEHLHSQLRDVNEKACFSKIGKSSPYDYLIEFSDMQCLQRLRNKVLETSAVLRSCLNVAVRLKAHCCALNESDLFTSTNHATLAIETYAGDLIFYQQSVAKIMESLQGTFDLLSKIIEFRNIERLHAINGASERSILLLKESVFEVREENRAAATLSVQNHKDAKTVKALATISIVFLPASLVATIFSSNLVQVQQDSTKGDHFVLATQFWIYVLLSIVLTFITIGCTRFMEYRWLKGILSLDKHAPVTC